MVLAGGLLGAWQGFVGMEYESWEVHGKEGVQSNNCRLASAERENHVPDGCRIKRGKPGAETPWGPIKDGNCDDIREPAESA